MRTFCLTKEQIETLKPKVKAVGGVKLATMPPLERRAFFTEALGNEYVGKEVAASFEAALISKQKGALKNWAKNVFTEKEQKAQGYKDVIAKIDRLTKEGVLSPTMTAEYLENLVATSLGVDLKPAEIQKINELSKKIDGLATTYEDAQAQLKADAAKEEDARMTDEERQRLEKVPKDYKADNVFGIPNMEYFKAREEMNNYLGSITPASQLELLSGVIGRGNLLFSIKSPLTNVISNVTSLFTEPIVRRAAARKFRGTNGDLMRPFVEHALKVYNETGYDVVRMLQMQDEQKTLGEGRTTTQGEGKVRALARFYEDLVFKKAMGTADVIAAAVHFADSLNVNSSALADTMGFTGAEHKAKARELFLQATSLNPRVAAEPSALREQAIADALYATYQNNSWLAEAMLKVRQQLDDATGGLKLGTNLEPFVKTPANVVLTSMEYSGYMLPFVVIKLPSAIQEAKNGHPEALRGLTRTAVRSGLGLVLAALIAGLLDKDDYIPDYANASAEDRKLVALGNASYNSVRVGGHWVSLDYFGVLGASLAGFASARHAEKGNGAMAFAESSWAQVQRVPVLSKIFDTYAYFNEANKYGKTPQEVVGEVAGGLVGDLYSRTVPMIVSDIAKGTDSSQRLNDYKSQIDDIQANIPFLRELLPKKYNDLGEIVPTENILFTLLFGARVKTANDNPVYEEISALSAKGIDVTVSTNKIQEMVAAKKLMSAEEYNEFHAQVQKNVATALSKIITTSSYENADLTEKEAMLEEVRKGVVQSTMYSEGYGSRIRKQIADDKKAAKDEAKAKGK